MPRRVAVLLALLTLAAVALPGSAAARCVLSTDHCSGCGCKGGPGWRENATGQCVGFRDIGRRCGDPPSSARCTFENAPGTGANRACALEPKTRRVPSQPR